MKRVRLFSGSSGLDTVSDPARIKFDHESGVTALAEAVNVDLDQTGRVSRRQGYEATAVTGPVHSLYSDGHVCLFVQGGTMMQLHGDMSVSAVRSGLRDDKVSYLSLNGAIYWSNGTDKGLFAGGMDDPWDAPAYVGPDTTRTYDEVPAGHLLEFYKGRIFVADGHVLWFTEPLGYSWVDRARNYIQFPSRIRMCVAVQDGLYVADANETYFIQGDTPKEFTRKTVATTGVVEGTCVKVPGHDLGFESNDICALWVSPDGVIAGNPGGFTANLSQRRIVVPAATFGVGALINNTYIFVLGT